MRRILTALSLLMLAAFSLRAQEEVPVPAVPPGYVLVDSLVFTPVALVDSTLGGRYLLGNVPDNIILGQSKQVHNAVEARFQENRGKLFQGYRIRIFFDNGQNARGASAGALGRFKALYPGVSAYLSFTNPYFKVTVGDYRSKSEAMAALTDIKRQFPAAFIIKETFKYPSMAATMSFRVDTVKVLRRVE